MWLKEGVLSWYSDLGNLSGCVVSQNTSLYVGHQTSHLTTLDPVCCLLVRSAMRTRSNVSGRAAPEVGKLNLILTHLLIHYTQLINSKVVVTMARLLRTITTPPCLLLYTIARNGGVVGGTSLARQTTTTGWCDFPSAIRPCFTSHLASPRRTCHSGTNRTVPPEKDVSCNNPG
ncbi:hypothetical protein Pcinc_002583 [Petrolisthes cinctipes]|uniref:Uncharacterized protein n=1 Tax=Petrolisthes cinctipes TaxID=88211 RepID=A0AAE1GID4_PETCI|nr:hypothetical protein Pcinc_002583 [Petrolisthes cinctipes]